MANAIKRISSALSDIKQWVSDNDLQEDNIADILDRVDDSLTDCSQAEFPGRYG